LIATFGTGITAARRVQPRGGELVRSSAFGGDSDLPFPDAGMFAAEGEHSARRAGRRGIHGPGYEVGTMRIAATLLSLFAVAGGVAEAQGVREGIMERGRRAVTSFENLDGEGGEVDFFEVGPCRFVGGTATPAFDPFGSRSGTHAWVTEGGMFGGFSSITFNWSDTIAEFHVRDVPEADELGLGGEGELWLLSAGSGLEILDVPEEWMRVRRRNLFVVFVVTTGVTTVDDFSVVRQGSGSGWDVEE
jgi:hypothetical protein